MVVYLSSFLSLIWFRPPLRSAILLGRRVNVKLKLMYFVVFSQYLDLYQCIETLMACLNTLKLEIKTLEQVFPKNHERFQIMSASVDELTCRFVGRNGKKYEIHANITVSKPIQTIPCFQSKLKCECVLLIYCLSGQRVVVYEGRAVNNGLRKLNIFPCCVQHVFMFSKYELTNRR